MFQLSDSSMSCPRVSCAGYLDWITTDGCYRCSTCEYEVWGGKSRTVSSRQANEVYKLHRKTVDKLRKHGGGSNNSGRKKKDKYKRNPNVEGVKPYLRDYMET